MMTYQKPKLEVQKISSIVGSSPGMISGDSQAMTGGPLVNVSTS